MEIILEPRINLETAKLAKEKGYDEMINGYLVEYLIDQIDEEYPDGGGAFSMTKGEVEFYSELSRNTELNEAGGETYDCYSCPTLYMLQKWLREKHNIIIQVNIVVENDYYFDILYSPIEKTRVYQTTKIDSEYDDFYETYEDALGEGLRQGLKII